MRRKPPTRVRRRPRCRRSASTTTTSTELPFDPHFLARLIPALIEGAEITVELAILTFAICLVWGLVVALANSTHGPLSWRFPAPTYRSCATRRC